MTKNSTCDILAQILSLEDFYRLCFNRNILKETLNTNSSHTQCHGGWFVSFHCFVFSPWKDATRKDVKTKRSHAKRTPCEITPCEKMTKCLKWRLFELEFRTFVLLVSGFFFSSFRMVLLRLFAWRLFVTKYEMAHTSHHIVRLHRHLFVILCTYT